MRFPQSRQRSLWCAGCADQLTVLRGVFSRRNCHRSIAHTFYTTCAAFCLFCQPHGRAGQAPPEGIRAGDRGRKWERRGDRSPQNGEGGSGLLG